MTAWDNTIFLLPSFGGKSSHTFWVQVVGSFYHLLILYSCVATIHMIFFPSRTRLAVLQDCRHLELFPASRLTVPKVSSGKERGVDCREVTQEEESRQKTDS